MSSKTTFGPFVLDVSAETLERQGVRVRLAGQPMRILIILTSRSDELVTRDELRQALWGDDTFVDFEQGLNTAINRLRQALGDSADSPLYVETVPGRGYRFVAPVSRPDVLGENAAASPVPPTRSGMALAGWLAFALLSAAILTWLGFVVFGKRSAPAVAPPAEGATRFTVEPPSGFRLEPAFTRQSFDVAPDGSSLVFTARGRDGRMHAWRRDLSDTELHPLASAESARTVFWGRDPSQLFFAIAGSLRLSSPQGEPFRIVSRQPDLVINGTVLTDNRLLVTNNRRQSYLVSMSGEESNRLAGAYPWPVALPNGTHILYLGFGSSSQHESVVRSARVDPELEGGAAIVSTNSRVEYVPSVGDRDKGHLLYIRAGNLLVQPFDAAGLEVTGPAKPLVSRVAHFSPSGAADFSASESGTLVYQPYVGRAQITWVDRTGTAVGTAGAVDQGIYHLHLSPDGRRIAADLYDIEDGYPHLWLFESASGRGRPLSSELTGGAVWSPDADRLVYSKVELGQLPQLWLRDLEAQDDRPLFPGLHPEQIQLPLDWSRDGRFVVYQSLLQGDLWLADLGPGGSLLPLASSDAFEHSGALSPDGRWLAFISDESQRPQVYLQRFDSAGGPFLRGERHQLSLRGALFLRWRGDGRELYFAGADGVLYAVAIEASEPDPPSAPSALFDFEIEATTPMITPYTFDVSADGERFLLPRLTTKERDRLVVVRDWRALLAAE